jgi:hypothetical protein
LFSFLAFRRLIIGELRSVRWGYAVFGCNVDVAAFRTTLVDIALRLRAAALRIRRYICVVLIIKSFVLRVLVRVLVERV